jgi:uncharacterized protein YjbI with pentapeptide repeats
MEFAKFGDTFEQDRRTLNHIGEMFTDYKGNPANLGFQFYTKDEMVELLKKQERSSDVPSFEALSAGWDSEELYYSFGKDGIQANTKAEAHVIMKSYPEIPLMEESFDENSVYFYKHRTPFFCKVINSTDEFNELLAGCDKDKTMIFRQCIIRNTDMRDANTHDAYIENCSFENTDMHNMDFSSSYMEDCRFVGCDLQNVDFTLRAFVKGEFTNCNMRGMQADRMTLAYVDVAECDITAADLYCDCNECTFTATKGAPMRFVSSFITNVLPDTVEAEIMHKHMDDVMNGRAEGDPIHKAELYDKAAHVAEDYQKLTGRREPSCRTEKAKMFDKMMEMAELMPEKYRIGKANDDMIPKLKQVRQVEKAKQEQTVDKRKTAQQNLF